MRVFLIGFMGCGKTTVGKKLAAKLGLPFYDLDQLIADKYKKSISEIFESDGEESFRKMENHVLNEILNNRLFLRNPKSEIRNSDDFVLSTGGGAPCYHNNMDIINSLGISVYLKMDPDKLFSRLAAKKHKRPLLKNLDENGMKKFIETKSAEREPFYRKAHITINAFNVDLKALISELNSFQQI